MTTDRVINCETARRSGSRRAACVCMQVPAAGYMLELGPCQNLVAAVGTPLVKKMRTAEIGKFNLHFEGRLKLNRSGKSAGCFLGRDAIAPYFGILQTCYDLHISADCQYILCIKPHF